LPISAAKYEHFVSGKAKRFHGKFGTNFDDVIEAKMNEYVPKNKSWIKDSELKAKKPMTE
jgi:hypothetical protein